MDKSTKNGTKDLEDRVRDMEADILKAKIWIGVIVALVTAVWAAGGWVATSLYHEYGLAVGAANAMEQKLSSGLGANLKTQPGDSGKDSCQRILDFQICWGTDTKITDKGEAKFAFTFPLPFADKPIASFATAGTMTGSQTQYNKFAPFSTSTDEKQASVAAETTNEFRQDVTLVTATYIAIGKPVKETKP
jgi:hypothetical protein